MRGPGFRYLGKRALRPLLFRYPPIGLQPERLQQWLRALIETAGVPGAVVEIGCSVGGTAAFSSRMLRRLGDDRPYVAVDTFGGFVGEQFDEDSTRGTPSRLRTQFSANSQPLVRKIVDGLGAPEVRLVQGEIATMPDERLPEVVSACLVDVDLSDPVFHALRRIVPRLAPGGVVLVDDCPESTSWQARVGYRRFVEGAGLAERYEFGMGIVGPVAPVPQPVPTSDEPPK